MPIDPSTVRWDSTPPAGGLSAADVQWDDEKGLDIDIVGGIPERSLTPEQQARRIQNITNAERTATDYENQLNQIELEASWQQPLGRILALGGRDVLEGLASVPDLVISPITALANKVLPESMQQQNLRGAVGQGLDVAGLPRPENAQERVLSNVNQSITGAATGVGLGNTLARSANPVVSGVGGTLASQPGLQAASAATGAGAAGLTREAGGGPGAQLVAGLLGGFAPAASTAGAQAAVRGALRGGEQGRQTMQQNIDAFNQVGTAPSVGQATERPVLRGLEQTLSRVPGSAGVMTRRAQEQAQEIGQGVEKTAMGLSPRTTAGEAGKSVQRGVTGEGGFIARTREKSNELYDKLDEAIPPETRVDVGTTANALKELNAAIPGAPQVSKFFQNARIQGIEGALIDDITGTAAVLSRPGIKDQADQLRRQLSEASSATAMDNAQKVAQFRAQQEANANAIRQRNAAIGSAGGKVPVPTREQIDERAALFEASLPKGASKSQIDEQVDSALGQLVDNKLPYEALKKLRTLVGQELENPSLVSDVPRSKWKTVYAALSKDLETAAGNSPQAKQAWNRANNYFNARMQRVELLDAAIDKAGGPEKVFKALWSGAADGDTTLRAVMQSIPKDAQRDLTAAFVRRLGRSNPSAQNDAGDAFSAQTFLTNWNRLSPEAKKTLFDRHGPGFSANMDKIAKVASNLREGSSTFSNPSGTAAAGAQIAGLTSFVTSLATGNPGVAAGVAGVSGATNLWARAMTNPRFVAWLANQTEKPVGAIPGQVAVLNNLAEKYNEPELAGVAELMNQAYQNQESEGNQ